MTGYQLLRTTSMTFTRVNRPIALALGLILTCSAYAADAPFAEHPAADELTRVFRAQSEISDFKPSGLSRRDYLPLMSSNLDYWSQCQNPKGAIIDPYEK